MAETKYQIFISSTYTDLRDERQAAVEAVLRAGHIPAGMELFAADNRSQLEVITTWIDESDIYMIILGTRYGSIEPESKLSYMEFEYRYALDNKKPVFGIVLSDKARDEKIGQLKSGAVDNPERLNKFRELVMTKMVRIVDNTDQIKIAVFEGIQTISKHAKLTGWARATNDSRQVARELARLTADNARLQQQLSKLESKSKSTSANGSTDEELYDTLSSIKIKIPRELAKTIPNPEAVPEELSLLDVFVKNSSTLAAGVTNSSFASDMETWLFKAASTLLSLGLAEFGKVPPRVLWQRIVLSKEGNRLATRFHHALAKVPMSEQGAATNGGMQEDEVT